MLCVNLGQVRQKVRRLKKTGSGSWSGLTPLYALGAHGAAHFANGGISGESGNVHIIRPMFGFLIQMDLGISR